MQNEKFSDNFKGCRKKRVSWNELHLDKLVVTTFMSNILDLKIHVQMAFSKIFDRNMQQCIKIIHTCVDFNYSLSLKLIELL